MRFVSYLTFLAGIVLVAIVFKLFLAPHLDLAAYFKNDRALVIDPPKPAIVTAPPYEPERKAVMRIEFNPDGDYPFKVWVDDGSGKEQYPYYATGIDFAEQEDT